MFKLLFTGLLVYVLYRFMVKPAMLGDSAEEEHSALDTDEEDFIDYEEVE